MNEKNDAYGRNDAQGVRNDSMNTDGRDIRDHRQDNGGMHGGNSGGNSGGSAYQRPQASGDAGHYGSPSGSAPQNDDSDRREQNRRPSGSQEHEGCGCRDRNGADKREQQNDSSVYIDPAQRR